MWAGKSRSSRGYGAPHVAVRARYACLVDAGEAVCARCGIPILPGDEWDLGHSEDRSSYTGPEHSRCNRSAGGRNGAAVTNSRRAAAAAKPTHVWSRVWEWPIPPDVYVAPEVVRAYLEAEARGSVGDL
jgi:hypothetical protein